MAEHRAGAGLVDATDGQSCRRCDGTHELIACPYVKAIEFEHPGDLSSIRRVEFLTPLDCAPPPRAGAAAPPPDDYPKKGP